MEIIGDVTGKVCIMIDDMIDTGGSIVQGAEALMERGAAAVHACCTHAILSGKAIERVELLAAALAGRDRYDPAAANETPPKIKVLSVAPLLARRHLPYP